MAVWQFYLQAIPREGVEKIHSHIPEKINISIEDGLFEADAKQYWVVSEFYPAKAIQRIDILIKRASWGNDVDSFNWKTLSDLPDNDAFLSVDLDSRNINHLHFRSDLREENLYFLKMMVALSNEMDWLLMDSKGIIVKPIIEDVIERVKASNVLRFLSDPGRFYDDLTEGKISLE